MTKEEKQLLLKDLCARLPYRVKVRISSESDVCLYVNTTTLDIDNLHKYMLDGRYYKHGLFHKTPCFQLLPYLRPMSSMTDEETKEYSKLWDLQDEFPTDADIQLKINVFNWLLEHHFDFRGLIEKGLALVAPEDMYETE